MESIYKSVGEILVKDDGACEGCLSQQQYDAFVASGMSFEEILINSLGDKAKIVDINDEKVIVVDIKK